MFRATGAVIEGLEARTLLSTVTLFDIADADVVSASGNGTAANANFGADPQLRVSVDPANHAETYLKFDLSTVSSIGNAVLQLHGAQVVSSTQASLVGVFPVPSTSWVEGNGTHSTLDTDNNPAGEIHWNTRPSSSGGAVDTNFITVAGDYLWNVTSYLRQQKAAGHNLVSLTLKNVGGNPGTVAFSSREGGSAPQLIIETNTSGPVVAFTSPNVQAPSATQQITATYTDPTGVAVSSIDINDITVTAPGHGPLSVVGVTIDASNPNAVTAVYSVAAPGGTWTPADNALWTTILQPGQVTDTAGNPAAGGPDAFFVQIGTGAGPGSGSLDATPPTVAAAGTDITTAGATTGTFTVTYADNDAINAATIDTTDATVGKQGAPTLRITGVTLSRSTNGTPITATYTYLAPGGTFGASDNGTYQINVKSGAVADVAGNLSPAATATFTVNIPGTPTPTPTPTPTDTTPPTAVVATLPPITSAGGTTQDIKVTYTDETAVDAGTVGVDDITVTRGGAVLPVIAVSATPPADGKIVTAIYTVAAPGGAWDASDNGTYAITVNAGAVSDTSGNPVGAAAGAFIVSVPGPKPPIDVGFSNGGTVSSGFIAEATATQPDGRIVVVGRQGDLAAGTSQAVVERLNANGSVDTSFGSGGKIVTSQGTNTANFAVLLGADGTILVGGTQNSDFLLTRYKSNGAIDRTFGTGGQTLTDFGQDDVAYALAFDPDGAIVAAGSSGDGTNSAFAFARYTGDGRPDVFFGEKGQSLFSMAGGGNVASSVAVQSDGQVVAAGSGGGQVVAVRLDHAGGPDATFGNGGEVTLATLTTRTDLGTMPDHTIGLALQGDGRAVIANRTAGGDFGVVRLASDGSIDRTFGTNGLATIDFGGDDDADQVIVQGTGEILVVGTTDAGGTPKAAVAALGRDGSPDTAFGTNGQFTTDIGVTSPIRALHIGDILLRAFGGVGSNGTLIVGTSEQSPAASASASSALRRLNVPGSGLVGRFGQLDGKNRTLSFINTDGTRVTLRLKGAGSGRAYFDGTNLDLVLSGTSAASAFAVKTAGGSGRLTIRNVQSDGALRTFAAKTADITGTIAVNGDLQRAMIASLTGTVAASASIGALTCYGNVDGGRVLAGASMGADGQSGGDGSAADAFGPGAIGLLSVRGSMNAALVAAGLDPVNGIYLDSDDRIVGGNASTISSIKIRGGVDPSTRFVANSFGVAKLPAPTDPMSDARFQVL